MNRLRGLFDAWWRRGSRRWSVGVAVLAVGVGGLGLSGCVSDPPPIIGPAAAGDGMAVVSWKAPAATQSPITAYVVTPWIGLARLTPVVFTSTETTQTVTGLTNDATYTFTVHAVHANGHASPESGMSNQVIPGSAVNVVPNPGFEQGGCGSTPVICGWAASDETMSQAGSPGNYFMELSCLGTTGVLTPGGGISKGSCESGGFLSVEAGTGGSSCAAIGAGNHPASFRYQAAEQEAWLFAYFYQSPDCTGTNFSKAQFTPGGGDGWQQAIGYLNAPAGTQSAVFVIGVRSPCVDDVCWAGADFDDLAVYA